VISARGLTKVYGGHTVVNRVGFDLRPGSVTALLGPNGAGKSTALRMVTGLTTPSAGQAWIAGRAFAEWPNPAHVAGVCLDASAVHPGRTGRAMLRNAATLAGLPAQRVDEVLATVGLAQEADRETREYGFGTRQRLGLARALLADPPVLILDEPAAGLDPEGVRAVRQLLRGHAGRGGTVLLASHDISEVQQMADRLLVMSHGMLLADGPPRQMPGSTRTCVRTADPPALLRALAAARIRAQQIGPDELAAEAPAQAVSDVASRAEAEVLELTEEQRSLEDLFLALTGGQPR
jgi:ABC-2 type transport system ATP-binding protein